LRDRESFEFGALRPTAMFGFDRRDLGKLRYQSWSDVSLRIRARWRYSVSSEFVCS